MSIVEFEKVTRVYKAGDHELKALDHIDFSLDEGKFVVILGPSGAGKSTLLNMLGGLDSPTSETIRVCGKDISTLSNNELADYRIYSESGFTEENIDAIKEIEGVDAATRYLTVNVTLKDTKKNGFVKCIGRLQCVYDACDKRSRI